MSNGTDRKSMDDVLASIRRIVRAEKEPEPAPHDATRIGAEPSAGAAGAGAFGAGGADEPLALTPDMRSDHGTVEPEAIARPSSPAGAGPTTAIVGASATPDRESLRTLVREILTEELANGAAESTVRNIIRDELTNGEIGGNISQNVLRLVQSEIAKALENR